MFEIWEVKLTIHVVSTYKRHAGVITLVLFMLQLVLRYIIALSESELLARRAFAMATGQENVIAMNNEGTLAEHLRSKKAKHEIADPFPRPPSPEVPLSRPSAVNVLQLRVKRLTDDAKLPTRATPDSAGLDLYSSHNVTIPAGQRALVKTDLQVAIPKGCYGRIAPRSGLALKHGLDVGAGVVDADYRGPLGVVMFNLGHEDFRVAVGDRVAQLICEKIEVPEIVECPGGLGETLRGEGGFGSTGGFANAKPLLTEKVNVPAGDSEN